MAILTPVTLTKNAYKTFASTAAWTTFATSSALTALTIQQDVDDKIIVYITGEGVAATGAKQIRALMRVAAGSKRRAWREGVGKYDAFLISTLATGVTRHYVFGPFESARFNTKSTSTDNAPLGRGYVTITPFNCTTAGATAGSNLTKASFKAIAFKIPSIVYST